MRSYTEVFVTIIISGLVGALITVGFLGPQRHQNKVKIKELTETVEKCVLEYKELIETTQFIINAANACVDLLWEAPVEEIEEVRTKRAKPTHLPDIITKPTLLESTIDPTFL